MARSERAEQGVQLPRDTSASTLFHRLLWDAVGHFDALSDVPIPEDPRAFRARFAEVVPQFEAARAVSEERGEIARRVALQAAGALVYRHESGDDEPLAKHLESAGIPLEMSVQRGRARRGLEVAIPFRGITRDAAGAGKLLDSLVGAHWCTPPAAEGIRWTLARIESGALDLAGQKFVVMGAGAELAPTPLLLAAGAQVLWLDVRAPTLAPDSHTGTLHAPSEGADLLARPRDVVATIREFAGSDPVHLGMFAYAAGGGREWRLEASMNAIARALPRDTVKSIGIYVSPTSAIVAHPVDVDAAEMLWAHPHRWQRTLVRIGMLRRSHISRGDLCVARTIVTTQGASYQATQYIAKVLAAEAFASARRAERVSANVAGISKTSSMSLPGFQAAFVGADNFGVGVFEPATMRWLSGLLLLHDVLAPEVASEPGRLFERQIHGGLTALPFAVEGAMRVAAMIGLARKPSLLAGFLRR